MSSFGDKETIGVLKNGAGEVVERLEPRANDWNVALSRRLPAGAYRLGLDALGRTRSPVTEPAPDEGAERRRSVGWIGGRRRQRGHGRRRE